jgi:hypothetical protein
VGSEKKWFLIIGITDNVTAASIVITNALMIVWS